MKELINQLREENAALTSEVEHLKADNDGLKKGCGELNDKLSLACTQNSYLTIKVKVLSEVAAELEQEKSRLIRYAEEQALLPSVSFEAARELVSDIKKDATDVGGCYEVSTGLLDSLFERYTDVGACSLLTKRDIEQRIKAFEQAKVPLKAKAGCIGEFKFFIEGGSCCPDCYHERNDDCEICNGETDENGVSDLEVTVPWDLCKTIWLRMNKIYAQQLRAQAKEV